MAETHTHGAHVQEEACKDAHQSDNVGPCGGEKRDMTGWHWSKWTLAFFVCLNFLKRECSHVLSK